MKNKKEDLSPVSDQELCAESLLMWSLKVQDLPTDFLMMDTRHPLYHEYQKWLTKFQLAIHCITDLEIGCSEDIAQLTIENYITKVYKKNLIEHLDRSLENES
tara:strand:+ start:1630 stop:1938 length:309 start_codon:yes stop_codon:yes gene_type:complete